MFSNSEPLGPKHPLLQRLRRLIERRSFRFSEEAFVVEGVRAVDEALHGHADLEAIYVGTDVRSDFITAVLDTAYQRDIPIIECVAGALEKIGDSISPQPILAVARMRLAELASVASMAAASNGFLVVCVELQDPGNAGTIIRSAESSGASGVVLCAGSVDAYNPKTVRSTAGAMFHIPVVAAGDAFSVIDVLREHGIFTWATHAREHGAIDYETADLRASVAFVLGNEAHGLSEDIQNHVDGLLTIPMIGKSESLNAGVAASVLCFEAARQRRQVM